MTDQRPSEPASDVSDEPKRAWSEPLIEVIPISDAEGPVSGFPYTDGLSGHS
jgi:hypothetical protein